MKKRQMNGNKSSVEPLVSILMTAYNRESYIREAIESVLESSYTNWELIITDDCSSDRTLEIAKEYESFDSRIAVYRNEKNLGDYPNRNRAASYANGKYLKYLDADDLIYPYGIATMVHAMESFPSAGFGLSYSVIDDLLPYPQLVSSIDIIKNEYLGKSLLASGPSASIINRNVFLEIGGFSGEQFIGDTDLWFRIAMHYPLVKLPPALNWYRSHDDQQIKLEEANNDVLIRRFLLRKDYLIKNKYLFNENEYSFAQRKLIRNYSRRNLKVLIETFNFKNYLSSFKNVGLSFGDVISGMKPYLHTYNKLDI